MAHRGHIGLITVSIGGNDVTACATQANPISCVATAVSGITKNVTGLAVALRSAAGPGVPLIGLTYPDVILGSYVYPKQPAPAGALSPGQALGGGLQITDQPGAHEVLRGGQGESRGRDEGNRRLRSADANRPVQPLRHHPGRGRQRLQPDVVLRTGKHPRQDEGLHLHRPTRGRQVPHDAPRPERIPGNMSARRAWHLGATRSSIPQEALHGCNEGRRVVHPGEVPRAGKKGEFGVTKSRIELAAPTQRWARCRSSPATSSTATASSARSAQAFTSGRPAPNPSPLTLCETAPHSLRARILFRIVQAFDSHGALATDGTTSGKIGTGFREEVANALAQTRCLLPPTEVPHECRLLAREPPQPSPSRPRPGLGCLVTPHPAVREHARHASLGPRPLHRAERKSADLVRICW